jgi:O-acetyl-ADP-ribose deacetylase (regulator of RNase III)
MSDSRGKLVQAVITQVTAEAIVNAANPEGGLGR